MTSGCSMMLPLFCCAITAEANSLGSEALMTLGVIGESVTRC
jgi:hypothetical protein